MGQNYTRDANLYQRRQRLGYGGRGIGRYPGHCYSSYNRPGGYSMLGTPSHPCPLDRVRSAERERAAMETARSIAGVVEDPGSTSDWETCYLPGAPPEVPWPSANTSLSNEQSPLPSPHLPPRHTLPASASQTSDVIQPNSMTSSAAGGHHSRHLERQLAANSARVALQRCLSRDTGPNSRHLTGRGVHDVSFASALPVSCYAPPPAAQVLPENSQSFAESWAFYNYVSDMSRPFVHTVRNPNKALCTINARTSEILTSNDMAAALFSVPSDELTGQRLSTFVQLKYRNTQVMETHLQDSGEIVEVSGKVLECVDSSGLHIPVSVWLKCLDRRTADEVSQQQAPAASSTSSNSSSGPTGTDFGLAGGSRPRTRGSDPKCLVIMEPVERLVSRLVVNGDGEIVGFDRETRNLFECLVDEELLLRPVETLISGIRGPLVPSQKKMKLNVTGRTKSGKNFPCFAVVAPRTKQDFSRTEIQDFAPHLSAMETLPDTLFLVTVWVFANISGLLSMTNTGGIHSCNPTLARMLFGYSLGDLLSLDITRLIPDFFTAAADSGAGGARGNHSGEDEDALELPQDVLRVMEDALPIGYMEANSEEQDTEELLAEAEAELARVAEVSGASTAAGHSGDVADKWSMELSVDREVKAKEDAVRKVIQTDTQHQQGGDQEAEHDRSLARPKAPLISSTPQKYRQASTASRRGFVSGGGVVYEGSFRGVGLHRDGTKIDLIYAVRRVELVSKGKELSDNSLDDSTKRPADDLPPPHPGDNSSSEDLEGGGRNGHAWVIWVSRDPEQPSFPAHAFSLSGSSFIFSRQQSGGGCPGGGGLGASQDWRHRLQGQFSTAEMLSLFEPSLGSSAGYSRSVSHLSSASQPAPGLTTAAYDSHLQQNAGNQWSDMHLPHLQDDITGNNSCSSSNQQQQSSALLLQLHLGDERETSFDGVGGGGGGEDGDNNVQVDPFDAEYEPLVVIGKGAFGFVRLARRVVDGAEVVIKYIRKSKLTADHLVEVSDLHPRQSFPSPPLNVTSRCPDTDSIQQPPPTSGDNLEVVTPSTATATCQLIPREVWMLHQLDHPNIVTVLDWCDTRDHFNLVMAKHGQGMDLFEFIDRSPNLDEPLVSFIFRQLVDAISYMHSLQIVHRDIKDENIILDERFRIKLIDFGAATRVKVDQKFRTFCGTMEFCSPEILLGNEYDCFSADVWSMGITLYTLMFGENPFYDYEETIQAVLKPPTRVSTEMLEVLSWMLDPQPETRATASQLTRHPWLRQRVSIDRYDFSSVLPNSDFKGNVAADYRPYSQDSGSPAPPLPPGLENNLSLSGQPVNHQNNHSSHHHQHQNQVARQLAAVGLTNNNSSSSQRQSNVSWVQEDPDLDPTRSHPAMELITDRLNRFGTSYDDVSG